jgi:hypothetical protein
LNRGLQGGIVRKPQIDPKPDKRSGAFHALQDKESKSRKARSIQSAGIRTHSKRFASSVAAPMALLSSVSVLVQAMPRCDFVPYSTHGTSRKGWTMKRLFTPNISNTGRLVRGFLALALFIGAGLAFRQSIWAALIMLGFGGFVLFEAIRGWCAVRACGIKTKL